VSLYRDNAGEYAQRAAYATGDQAMAEAVGAGLAAVANAVLEVANQVDELRRTIDQRLAELERPVER
jgi:hypothetical protein